MKLQFATLSRLFLSFILIYSLSICTNISLGQSNCENMSVPGIHVNPFNMNELTLHSFNENDSEIFDYPGWRLYDESGILIAEEQVQFFGIVGNSIHSLNLIEPLDYSVQSFYGTLELWTGFYDVLECSYDLEIFPWRVDESTDEPYGCVPIGISLQGFSEEGTSIEVSITDENASSVFEETYIMEAGSFGGYLGATCLDQEQCYYLSIISEDGIDNMQYSILSETEDVYFFYVFDEIGEGEILLNPFGQGVCDGSPNTTVDGLEAFSVLIYPNPSSNNLTVDLGDLNGVSTTVKLYDSSSKMIFEKKSNTTLMIDVSGVAKGMYSLELSTDEQVLRRQVVIE
jgi:uncharacterized protein (DUF779 family)